MKIVVLLIWAWITRAEAQICNGSPEFCSLRFDQITLAGAHGAGIGLRQIVNCDGSPGDYCLLQTQTLSISEQLKRGVRFLSLDVCILPQSCNTTGFGDLSMSRLVTCHGAGATTMNGFRYGGRLIDVFDQVDSWLGDNTNEVIALHFTRNIPTDEVAAVGLMIASLLESKWGKGATNASLQSPGDTSSTEMSTFYNQTGTWPTLLTAIDDNQRIIVYFDSQLISASIVSSPWLYPAPYVSPSIFTRELVDIDNDCSQLDNVICEGINDDVLVLSGFGYASCLNFAQTTCNSKLDTAALSCFNDRIRDNQTVNAIIVDLVGSGPVYNITADINRMNVMYFAPQLLETTSPPNTIASTNGPETDANSNNTQQTSFTVNNGAESQFQWLSYTLILFISTTVLHITL